ncbi:hypothetical protein A5767_16300 [Rhodococcus sp. 852002-51564_SCH6189132-a]|uniref:hypothetical protein n=1 Tax=unclassified Rhodococcus (in: high G+C Gram-positive bacteria) TaxID=192944 RepID=UPI0007D90E4E|nr:MULTISPECIES: hypothetical protein [unclassified Rhodococcus (in: high G+C Gram-positive bacteria)]OBA32783.1 hypothetical protein A5767_16300 [Rhodococcus sp. 852002-51564_SCH6189132-a]
MNDQRRQAADYIASLTDNELTQFVTESRGGDTNTQRFARQLLGGTKADHDARTQANRELLRQVFGKKDDQ